MTTSLASLGLALATLGTLATGAHAQCQVDKLLASDGTTDDWFGWDIGISGSRMVVGAVWDSDEGALAGSCYVFERSPSGWVETAKLIASDADPDDMLGIGVSIHGDRILGGAYRNDDLASNSGAAYVYDLVGGSWVESAKLIAADGSAEDRLGWDVTLWGDRAVLGAYQDDDLGQQSGSAYVFEFDGTTWTETAKLTASDGAGGDLFAEDLFLVGDTLILGAKWDDDLGSNAGAAYVFEYSGGAWNETAKLVASDGSAQAEFGFAVHLTDDAQRAFVSAVGAGGAGAVYVFDRQGPGWVETARMDPLDGAPAQRFGTGVWHDAGRLAVGAEGDSHAGAGSGAAYLFEFDGQDWSQRARTVAEDAASSDYYGYTVGLLGDEVLVGSKWDGDNGPRSGSVYVHHVEDAVHSYCQCTSGPCTNHSTAGGCRNSTGEGAELTACGTTSVAADDLVLTMAGVPAGQFGLHYMGAGAVDLPFGDGARCVGSGGAGVFRFAVQASDSSGTIGLGPGIVAEAAVRFGLPGQISSGATWYFQGWYRDPSGPCGTGFNLTQGLEVLFLP